MGGEDTELISDVPGLGGLRERGGPVAQLEIPPQPSQKSGQPHIPALDGLRGLAIALVLITHLVQIEPVSRLDKIINQLTEACRHGVDLFFVLSGFLITGILLDTRSGSGYFRNFYGRRTLRIFPLYYASLFLVFVLLPAAGIVQPEQLRQTEWALWTYCSNFVIALRHGWIYDSPSVRLSHFWSLAVEEQFYLVWPFVIALFSRRTVFKLCAALVLFAALVRAFLASRGIPAISILVLTPCRVDTLAVGAMLAVLARRSGGLRALVVPARWTMRGFLVLLPLSLWFKAINESAAQTINYSILAFGFGSMLVLSLLAPQGSWTNRVFTSPLLRSLGKYSYGIYVIHGMLIPAFDRMFGVSLLFQRIPNRYADALLYFLASTTLSIAAALISWNLFERHFLSLKKLFN